MQQKVSTIMKKDKNIFIQRKRKCVLLTLDEEIIEKIRDYALKQGLTKVCPETKKPRGVLSRAIEALALEALERRTK